MYNIKLLLYSFAIILILLSSNYSSVYFSYGAYSKALPSPDGPTINDDSLTVEKVTSGLKFPTSMTFVGNNDMLVTEKNTGRVIRVLDGQVQDNPLVDLPVATKIENLINLDKLLLRKEFTFMALQLKLKNCSGSPIRALAIIA